MTAVRWRGKTSSTRLCGSFARALGTRRGLTWGVVFLVMALSGVALTQAGGCARCSSADSPDTSGFSSGFRPGSAVYEPPAPREDRRKRGGGGADHGMRIEAASGGGYMICVRACDGGFFPVTYSGGKSRADSLQQVCQALCPNIEVALYSMPWGGVIDEAVSSGGVPYASLANAHKFEQSFDPSCSCRAPGQSWAQALARAEARYGRSPRDILVTAEQAARMSRPAQDPKRAASPAIQKAAAEAEAPLALDVNGVDTKLGAAAKAMSRETSGIKDDEQRESSFGLTAGRISDETGKDGAIRRVRILPGID